MEVFSWETRIETKAGLGISNAGSTTTTEAHYTSTLQRQHQNPVRKGDTARSFASELDEPPTNFPHAHEY